MELNLHQWRRLAMVFAPILLVVVATGLLALRMYRDQSDDQRALDHAYAVAAQLFLVETTLHEAELNQSNYVLVGDTTALAAYTQESANLRVYTAQLQTVTLADTTQRSRAITLNSLIEQWLTVMRQATALRSQQHTADAIAMIESATSLQTARSINVLLTEMQTNEKQQSVARLRVEGERFFEGEGPLFATLLANVLLLAAIFAIVRIAVVQREHLLQRERAARGEAEAAIALRDQFFSVVSHELRTPLAVLLPTVELLARRLSSVIQGDARLTRDFATLRRQLNRLQSLVGAMLDVSRIQNAQLSIQHDLLNLTNLVETVVDEVRPIATNHPIELHTDDEPLYVKGDAVRLSQVLLNLLQNAMKYSPEGGPITIEVARAGDEAVISVADHGVGISPDAAPHVFERFYRASSARSEHISGMGIGLYVAAEVVALHGGKIAVSSTEGVGSTFTIRLPILATGAPRPQAEADVMADGASVRDELKATSEAEGAAAS